MDNKERIKFIEELRNCDHAFLSPEGVQYFCEPFGFEGTTYTARANPQDFKGLTLKDGQSEAVGQDSEKVAEQIANHLGIHCGKHYPAMHGRGSALRVICEAIIKKLEQ